MKNEMARKKSSFWNILNWLLCKKSDEQYARDQDRNHRHGTTTKRNNWKQIDKEVHVASLKANRWR